MIATGTSIPLLTVIRRCAGNGRDVRLAQLANLGNHTSSWPGSAICQSRALGNVCRKIANALGADAKSVALKYRTWTLLQSTAETTVCPWKGTARYFTVSVNGALNPGAAWTYPDSAPEAESIRGYVAFGRGVDVG